MEKIYNKHFNETIYQEVLDNGLRVFIFNRINYETTTCLLAVPYGQFHYKQYLNGKLIDLPLGTAHFLEHKLFEDKEKDIMGLFSSLGASVNAYTNYDMTAYYFQTSSKQIKDSLNLLLDFTSKLDINQESVDKEKEIIKQEILMNNLAIDRLLYLETFRAVFKNHPLRNDIAGTLKSVDSIKVRHLQKAYQMNYHPANMVLVISSPINPEELIRIIKNNQNNKKYQKFIKPQAFDYHEPIEVNKKRKKLIADVHLTKNTITFKYKPLNSNNLDNKKFEICLKYLLMNTFSSLNKDYQKWLDQKIISNYFDYDLEIMNDCFILMFVDDNENPIKLKNFIIKQLNKMKKKKMSIKTFNQIQKRFNGLTILALDDSFELCNAFVKLYFDNINFFDLLELYSTIKIEDLNEVLDKLDFDNYSLLTISKK